MTYEAWRISYQSAEQAARAAYRQVEQLTTELEGLEPVAWLYDWQVPEGLIRDWATASREEIPKSAINIRALFARPIPADPLNTRLAEALEKRGYTGIDIHWSGYRVVIGFATLDAAKQAQVEIGATRSISSGQ